MSRRRALVVLLLLAGCIVPSVATTQADMNGLKPGSQTLGRREDGSRPLAIEFDKVDRFDEDRLLIFIGHVVARRYDFQLYADRIYAYLDGTDHILRATAIGNVRITTIDCREGMARRAEYHARDGFVVLSGNARLSPDEGFITGVAIYIYLPLRRPRDCGPEGDEAAPPLTAKGPRTRLLVPIGDASAPPARSPRSGARGRRRVGVRAPSHR
jgi:lipopolysaccharide transport protein LptA